MEWREIMEKFKNLNLLKQAEIPLGFQRPPLVIPIYAQQENRGNVNLYFGSATLRASDLVEIQIQSPFYSTVMQVGV